MKDSFLHFTQHRFVFKILRLYSAACLLGLVCVVSNASAQIVLDFRHDNGFFSGNSEATAAVEAAASDINSILDLNLGAVTDTTDGSSGGGTSVTFDFSFQYNNPTTNNLETLDNTALAANEIRIFVGSQILGTNGGGSDTLGEGGPGGLSFAATGFVGTGSFQDAVDDAAANDTHGRNDGPLISLIAGSFTSGETVSFDFGASIGSLVFDEDTDWHFDHTTPVASGKFDFYSVALHEMLHAIGIGTSESWNMLADGDDWLGSEVIASNGTGVGIIEGDGAHFAEGLTSTSIINGVSQEAAMDPNIRIGFRKALTQVDVAALRDLGFSTILPVIPLLGDVNLDGEVDFLDISPFIRVLLSGDFLEEADLNQDGEVNFLDISPFISILSGG